MLLKLEFILKKQLMKLLKILFLKMKAVGLSYDWDLEIKTSSPEYYKWTQWFFLLLFKHGLAYKKKAKVNWCG